MRLGALPPCSGTSKSTAHRRFLIRSRAGVRGRIHEEILHRLDDAGLLHLSRTVLGSAHMRSKKGRTHRSGPRGLEQAGFQEARPVGCERTCLLVGLSAANSHDSQAPEGHGGGSPNET